MSVLIYALTLSSLGIISEKKWDCIGDTKDPRAEFCSIGAKKELSYKKMQGIV